MTALEDPTAELMARSYPVTVKDNASSGTQMRFMR